MTENRYVREFRDAEGVNWSVGVREAPGLDFKGRFVFAVAPAPDAATGPTAGKPGGAPGPELLLEDVRWNSEKTARRTLETMSPVELERRVAWARGRRASAGNPTGSAI